MGLGDFLDDECDCYLDGIGATTPRPAPALVRAGLRSVELTMKRSAAGAKGLKLNAPAKPPTGKAAPKPTVQQAQQLQAAAALLARAKTPAQQQAALAAAARAGYNAQAAARAAATRAIGKRGVGVDGLGGGGFPDGDPTTPTTDPANPNGVPANYVPKDAAWVATTHDGGMSSLYPSGTRVAFPAINMTAARGKQYVLPPGNPFEAAPGKLKYLQPPVRVLTPGFDLFNNTDPDNTARQNITAAVADMKRKKPTAQLAAISAPGTSSEKTPETFRETDIGSFRRSSPFVQLYFIDRTKANLNEALFAGDDLRWDKHAPSGAFLQLFGLDGAQWTKYPADFWSVDAPDGQAAFFDIMTPVNLDWLDQLQQTDPGTALTDLVAKLLVHAARKGQGFITVYDNLGPLGGAATGVQRPPGIPADATFDATTGLFYSAKAGMYFDPTTGAPTTKPPAGTVYDPGSGTFTNPTTGQQYDPITGQPLQASDPYAEAGAYPSYNPYGLQPGDTTDLPPNYAPPEGYYPAYDGGFVVAPGADFSPPVAAAGQAAGLPPAMSFADIEQSFSPEEAFAYPDQDYAEAGFVDDGFTEAPITTDLDGGPAPAEGAALPDDGSEEDVMTSEGF